MKSHGPKIENKDFGPTLGNRNKTSLKVPASIISSTKEISNNSSWFRMNQKKNKRTSHFKTK